MVSYLQNHLSARLYRHGKQGQGLVEYALILVLVSIAAVAILVLFGEELNNVFSAIVDALPG